MALVKVRLMGSLRRILGMGEVELTIEQPSEVALVIQRLSEKLGGRGIIDSKDPTVEALILINGVEIGNLEGLETPVDDGDVLVIIPVTHGG